MTRRSHAAAVLYDQIVGVLSRSAAVFSAALLAAVAVSVCYEVVARYVFGSPTVWSNEMTIYAILWCCFLGAPYTLRRNRHLEVDLVVIRLSPTARKCLGLITDFVCVAFCVLAVRQAIVFVHVSYVTEAQSVSELEVPLYIPEMAIPVGLALLGLEFVARLLRRLGLAGELVAAPDDLTRGAV